jgi:hypothetical protein
MRTDVPSLPKTDPAGRVMKTAWWPNSYVTPIVRYPIVGAWSPAGTSGASALYDGKYSNAYQYNAGDPLGSFIIDLGTWRTNITHVRITLATSAGMSGTPVNFAISPTSVINGAVNTDYRYPVIPIQGNMAPYTIELDRPINTRYLLVIGQNPSSWFAVTEIEVYSSNSGASGGNP